MVEISERYTVLDIESWCPKGTPDPEVDELRYVGFRNFKGKNIHYHHSQREEIQKCISYFKYLVGHNIIDYDKRVLERHGFIFTKEHIFLDTQRIAEKRFKSMLYMDLNKGDYNLRKLAEILNLSHKKGDFDYKLLKNDPLTGNDLDDLIEYLYGDLETNDDLFKYQYELFHGFKPLVSERNQQNMSWLTAPSGTVSYKILCNLAGLKEEYNDVDDEDKEDFEGGYVLSPKYDFVEGPIEYRDATSLYPHVYMMGNLFSPVKKGCGWNGRGVYPNIYANENDGVRGTYSTEPGKMEGIFRFLFTERAKINKEKKTHPVDSEEYIRLDRAQLPLKICMNSAYGACSNPRFKSIYNLTTAMDCTAMARRTTKYARTVLEEYGYEVIYGDTDSLIVKDVYNDKNKLNEIFEYIRQEQLNSANIKIDTHGFKLECRIKHIYFFKNEKDEYAKKYYIYVDEDNRVTEKGIRIVRGDCSPIAKTVYEKYIKPLALKGESLKLSIEQITNWLKDEIKLNPEQLKKRYRLKPLDQYKIAEGKDESTALHAQLSKRYGAGEHYFVVNKRIGPGKGNHYCTLEELKEKYGDEWVDQIKLDMYLNDLKCFVCDEERKKIK